MMMFKWEEIVLLDLLADLGASLGIGDLVIRASELQFTPYAVMQFDTNWVAGKRIFCILGEVSFSLFHTFMESSLGQ